MTWPTRPPLGIKCDTPGCLTYASDYTLAGVPVCHHHGKLPDVICSYFECRERATKNLTVTEPLDGMDGVETYEVPYCDVHYEEYR